MKQVCDMNGTPLNEGDTVNVFFTSSGGEHIHDCIYRVSRGPLGNITFFFVDLLWKDHGWNQYPINTQLCLEYKTLECRVDDNNVYPIVPDTYGENHLFGNRWKGMDKSTYFVRMKA